MENTEQTSNNKMQAGVKLDPELYTIVDRFRADEDRSMSNMIERLLKTHPRVQKALSSEPKSAAAEAVPV